MSLANDKDIIIPNTTGIIKSLALDANNEETLKEYLQGISYTHSIVDGRIKGIPLEELVPKERIASGEAASTKENETGVYEPWFRD